MIKITRQGKKEVRSIPGYSIRAGTVFTGRIGGGASSLFLRIQGSIVDLGAPGTRVWGPTDDEDDCKGAYPDVYEFVAVDIEIKVTGPSTGLNADDAIEAEGE